MSTDGTIVAICTSPKKGTAKTERETVTVLPDHGFQGDAHAGNWHRQVSLLSCEQVDAFREQGGQVENGAFGENLLIRGIDLARLPLGTRLRSGEVLLEVTQIGKECHAHCAIYHQVGDCIMPREGIFARVRSGGILKKGDKIHAESPHNNQ